MQLAIGKGRSISIHERMLRFLTNELLTLMKIAVQIIFFEVFQLNAQNTQPAVTCSKLPIETLEQGVKYLRS